MPLYFICQACGAVVGMQPGLQRCPNSPNDPRHRMQGPEPNLSVPLYRCCEVCHWVEEWQRQQQPVIGNCPMDSRHGALLVLTPRRRNDLLDMEQRDLRARQPRYDRQVIVTIRTVDEDLDVPLDQDPDTVVRQAAAALHEKAQARGLPSVSLWVRNTNEAWGTIAALGQLTDQSRLYLVGHSNGVRLQDIDAPTLSARLKSSGFRRAQRVTLVACRAGDAEPLYDCLQLARNFHYALGRYQPYVRTVVAAYLRPIALVTQRVIDNTDAFRDRPWTGGVKLIYTDDGMRYVSSVRGTQKVLWFWDGQQQKSMHGLIED